MFISKFDDNRINKLTLVTDQILKDAMASKSPKVQHMYTSYQAKWFNFMKRYKVEDYFDETAMIVFFRNFKTITNQEPYGQYTPASTHGIS